MDKPVEQHEGQPAQSTDVSPHVGQKNVLMAALSYVGPLIIISYLVAKDDPFVKFHIRQGAILFIIEVALFVITSLFWSIFWSMEMFLQIINLGLLVLSVIGIINAVQSKEKELPLIGHLSVHIPL